MLLFLHKRVFHFVEDYVGTKAILLIPHICVHEPSFTKTWNVVH